MNVPTELLLLVFLHGFKGGSDTFAQFPQRLQNGLSATQPNVEVQAEVYPPYETRGELIAAVDKHVEWLTELVKTRKAAFVEKGGKGPVRVVLLGHSMGGLVIVDSLLALLMNDEMGPVMLGVCAFDTPYWGLNPNVFKNTAAKYLAYAQNGHAVLSGLGVATGLFSAWGSKAPAEEAQAASPSASSSKKSSSKEVAPTEATPANASAGWGSWMPSPLAAGAAAAIVGAGAAAWWQKDTIATSWTWATSHLSFVVELWKADVLEKRMSEVEEVQQTDVGFHCYYTLLPKTTENPNPSRTFIILPHASPSSPISTSFTPNLNSRAGDEIGAHIEMFTDKSDGLYSLGSETSTLIGEWLDRARNNEKNGKKFVKREVKMV